MTKQMTTRRIGRLHAQNRTDAAWRAQQARVDADIADLSRDTNADRMIEEMDATGVEPREQIARLKTYFRRRQTGRTLGGS